MTDRDERRRILDEQRRILAEAHELQALDERLDTEQQRCEQMLQNDPLRAYWYDFEPPKK